MVAETRWRRRIVGVARPSQRVGGPARAGVESLRCRCRARWQRYAASCAESVSGWRSCGRRLGVVGVEEVFVCEDGGGGGWEVGREFEVEEDFSDDAGVGEQS